MVVLVAKNGQKRSEKQIQTIMEKLAKKNGILNLRGKKADVFLEKLIVTVVALYREKNGEKPSKKLIKIKIKV